MLSARPRRPPHDDRKNMKTGENEANTHETRQRGPGIGTSCRSRTSTVENLDGTPLTSLTPKCPRDDTGVPSRCWMRPVRG